MSARGYMGIPATRGQENVWEEYAGSYQGEWFIIAKDTDSYHFYHGHYGSCSYCDPYESFCSDYSYNDLTDEQYREFAADYSPYVSVPRATMETILAHNDFMSIIPANIRSYYTEFTEENWKEAEKAIREDLYGNTDNKILVTNWPSKDEASTIVDRGTTDVHMDVQANV